MEIMDDQSRQLDLEIGLLEANGEFFPDESMLSMEESTPQPHVGLDSLQAEEVMNMQARHGELFGQYAENKQRQQGLITGLMTRLMDLASEASTKKTAANATMRELLSEHDKLDPHCFAIRHYEALKEVQNATECEASLSEIVENKHQQLRKAIKKGADIAFELKMLEMELQKADPNFQLYNYGQVGAEFSMVD